MTGVNNGRPDLCSTVTFRAAKNGLCPEYLACTLETPVSGLKSKETPTSSVMGTPTETDKQTADKKRETPNTTTEPADKDCKECKVMTENIFVGGTNDMKDSFRAHCRCEEKMIMKSVCEVRNYESPKCLFSTCDTTTCPIQDILHHHLCDV